MTVIYLLFALLCLVVEVPCWWIFGLPVMFGLEVASGDSGEPLVGILAVAAIGLTALQFALFGKIIRGFGEEGKEGGAFLDSVLLVSLLVFCRIAARLLGIGSFVYVAIPLCFAIAVGLWFLFNNRGLCMVSLLILFGIAYLFSPKIRDHYAAIRDYFASKRERREELRIQSEEAAEAESLRRQKEAKDAENFEKLKTFALNHAPAIWETYQKLGSEIDIQIERNAKLRDTMAIFGRDAGSDKDYLACEAWVEEMRKTRGELLKRLEEAYFAKRKADATPGHADVEALWKKAQEDGIQEAEAAARRFREMTEQK